MYGKKKKLRDRMSNDARTKPESVKEKLMSERHTVE